MIDCSCNADSVDLDLFNMADPSLNGMLSARGMMYYEDGSSAIMEDSIVSSGMYSSPQYTDSGSNTPYVPLPEMCSLDQSGQMLDYMSGIL